jgi:hypothetical protein
VPIVGERSEGSRRAPRRWLVGSGVLLGMLLIALPLVPFVAPMTLLLGDRWLVAYVQWNIAPPQQLWVGGYSVSTGAYACMLSAGRLRYTIQTGTTLPQSLTLAPRMPAGVPRSPAESPQRLTTHP